MRISVHLRGGANYTDQRVKPLIQGFQALGHKVFILARKTWLQDSDLTIQTGFAKSAALEAAIAAGRPYLIMEAPPFRDLYDMAEVSTFTYNGLAGGGTRPKPKKAPRPKPELQTIKREGLVGIIGQKPTDHSMRGYDHAQWLLDTMRDNPAAILREHPLMVHRPRDHGIAHWLGDIHRLIVWNSTAAVDGLISGCKVRIEGPGCEARTGEPREEALHRLSWAQFTHEELATESTCEYILEGYERSREDARAGNIEIPRSKLNSQSIDKHYYELVNNVKS